MARVRLMLPISAAILLVCSQTYAQGLRYSLSPLAPFPCSAVSFDGNNVVFRRTIVIVCNGKEQLEMPAGSIMGANAVCDGTTLILHHDYAVRNGLFDILRRSCERHERRR